MSVVNCSYLTQPTKFFFSLPLFSANVNIDKTVRKLQTSSTDIQQLIEYLIDDYDKNFNTKPNTQSCFLNLPLFVTNVNGDKET
jgi:hypothetical protein